MYKAGVAGLFHFVLCSFRLVPGPDWRHGRFGPEGQLCIKSTVMSVLGWFAGDSAPRTVFLALSSGPRYAASWPVWTRGTVMSVLGWFAGDSAPRAVFLPVVRPKMRCIMAQRYSCVSAWMVCLVLGPGRSHARVCNDRCLWFRLQKTVESLQLQSFLVVDISCRGAVADSHGPFYHRDSPATIH